MARGLTTIEHDPGDMPSDLPSLATKIAEGGTLTTSERTLFGDVMTAQPTRAPRNEPRILQKIDAMAQANGMEWFYRFPVKKKGGGIDYIEGPSIECADAVARYYGNCQVASAVQDVGAYWIIHSRFVDLETGYTLIRPFMQSKTGSRMGGDDDERRLQIALGIGTSKSQRNVIDHALKDFTSRAFRGAKQSLVERIGKNLPGYRERATAALQNIDVPLARVERVYGRKLADMLAPDLARLSAELQALKDGMATIDETWPLEAPAEPRRTDATEINDTPAAAPSPSPPNDGSSGGPASPSTTPPGPPQGQPSQGAGSPGNSPPPLWVVPESVIGQDNLLAALAKLLDAAKTTEDVDSIERLNAERIGKVTGNKAANWRDSVRQKRLALLDASERQ